MPLSTLPAELWRLVYEFDATYRRAYNLCLLQLVLVFDECAGCVGCVLHRCWCERLTWAMVAEAPVVLSWNVRRDSDGHRPSLYSMHGCGCKQCKPSKMPHYHKSKPRAKPKKGGRRRRR